ncbi:hypothetical protein WICPIJ_007376 [Wickerhamomyces pijperi]|uniref:Glycerophosphocholine phosphodiesterase n=1 Tax=Wickerhamomyces pijperi TaxID=599730 RepID=A0A9P8TK49_WICPI|nr:hypothetical protein WICPIJ_007376 [Wickerhamomyces pijperi]
MKFGKTFTNHQIPEWTGYYINYKDLKRQIKLVVELSNQTAKEGAIAGFFFTLDRNVEKVDEFYNRQYLEYERRFERISSLVLNGESKEINDSLTDEEIEEVSGILMELRSSFRNLKWFAELNKRGFVKILKKFDKKTVSNQKDAYLATKVDPLLFANEQQIVAILSQIGETLTRFSSSSVKTTPSARTTKYSTTTSTRVDVDTFAGFIETDDDVGLLRALEDHFPESTSPIKLNIALLTKSALRGSLRCFSKVLDLVGTLADPADINGRNFFHHYIIALGRRQLAETEESEESVNNKSPVSSLIDLSYTPKTPLQSPLTRKATTATVSSLRFIMESIPERFRASLSELDQHKRTPLHHASKYGLVEETKIIVEFLKKWNQWDDTVALADVSKWGDSEGFTPLSLAIREKQIELVKILVSGQRLTDSNMLILATRLDSAELLQVLLSQEGLNVNHEDSNGESLLFIACKLNRFECVKLLLQHRANVEIKESSYGWTPIFIACINGFEQIVSLLKSSGARYDQCDASGWLPMEHACLRGHLTIADLVKPQDYDENMVKPYLQSTSNSNSNSNSRADSASPSLKQQQEPVKSFGHRYLKSQECMIVITLGSNDTRSTESALRLDKVPVSQTHSTKLDTALSLVIHRKGAHPERELPTVIDLPIDDAEPIIINCGSGADPANEVIFFDIVPTYGEQQTLGRGVASVKALVPKVGPNKTLLNKACSISILELESLDVLGSINFELLLVTPFEHPNMSPTRTETYWKSLITSRVIGHRGLGKNSNTRASLQLGENTVESFIAAASLGASYVEFDVQLTKDSQPVIYHDFLVAESGVDIPMHELTLEQFLHLGDMNGTAAASTSSASASASASGSSEGSTIDLDSKAATTVADTETIKPKLRARSSSHSVHLDRLSKDQELNHANLEKMKLTRTYKVNKGFKGNSRGLNIASSFVTLKDLFKKVPKNVGFNIECKYPLLYELQDEDLGELFIELNHWVDTVLKTVFDHADGRDVIFSSFHPETCMLLSLKQPSIPVLFLTESGTSYMPDTRTDSLQSAIRFCKKWNLLGIVSESKPILKCPRLVSIVKQQGLVCFTYGSENNKPENSKLQMSSGVDAVIVDSVLAVRKGLQAKDTTTSIFTV